MKYQFEWRPDSNNPAYTFTNIIYQHWSDGLNEVNCPQFQLQDLAVI